MIHYSIQRDHLHLIVEAADTERLSRGMQGLLGSMAKRLNKLWSRMGRVVADRFHDRILKTPRQVRNALRYVLNNALPWPDEAARFLMLWMTGFMGPAAYRRGGFVAIDMVSRFLPRVPVLLFALFLLGLSLAVLVVALKFGFLHVKSGWLFSSSTLKIPLQLFGGKAVAIKLAWTHLSLYVGVILLLTVTIELILTVVARLAAEYPDTPEDAAEAVVGAE